MVTRCVVLRYHPPIYVEIVILFQQWPVPSNGAYGSISGNSGDLGL